MSLLLMNGPQSAGQGVNLHHMPNSGHNAPCELLTRKLTQIAASLISGPVEGNLQTILAEKNIGNDIMTIFIGDRESLMMSPLGQAFTVTYCHEIKGKMKDQFWLVAVSPAQIKNSNVRPDTSRSFVDEREYTENTRQATIFVPGSVAQTMKKLRSQLHEFDVSHITGLEGDGWGARNVANAEKLEQYVQDIENQLGAAFAPAAFGLKKGLEYGVSDEAIMIVVRGSLPQPLAEAVNTYMTSITDHTPGMWQTESELYRSIIAKYESNIMAQTYGLAKDPQEFIAKLIETGSQHVQKLVHDNTDKAVIRFNGFNIEINGIVMVSAQTYNFLTRNPYTKNQLQWGKLINPKPVYHKPWVGLAESDPNKILRIVHDQAQTHNAADGSALEQLLQTTMDPKTYPPPADPAMGLLNLTQHGEKLLADQPLKDTGAKNTRPSKDDKYKLGSYDVTPNCCFVMHGDEAVIISPVPAQINTQSALPDADGRSPSLVAREKVLFRASVGDLNTDHDLLKSWAKFICEDRDRHGVPPTVTPSSYFTTKSVSIHTPAVSSQQLVFGNTEVKTVMFDPSLYDPTHLANAFNSNLRRVKELRGSALKEVLFLHDALTILIKLVMRGDDHFKNYFEKVQYNTITQNPDALNIMSKMELTPFHSVGLITTGVGQYEIIFIKRPFYHAIPIIDANILNIRACTFLNRTITISPDIRALNNSLTTLVGKNFFVDRKLNQDAVSVLPVVGEDGQPLPVIQANVNDLIAVANKLYDLFSTWVVPRKMKELNFLFSGDNTAKKTWFLIKYVLMPVLTKGRVKFTSQARYEHDVFTHLDTDFVEIMQNEDDLYAMFNGDQCHAETHKAVMSARTFWITTKSNWPLIVQVAAIMMDYWLMTPLAMGAQIDMGICTGYTVDFVKEEIMNCEQAVYTRRNAYELILSPVGKTVEVGADDAVEILSSCKIMTTRNTIGAGSVMANMEVPNPNAVPRAADRKRSPVISTDFISRTSHCTLEALLDDLPELTKKDKQVIAKHMELPLDITQERNILHADEGGDTEQFVGLLRPARTSTSDNIPLLGRVADLIPAKTSKVSGWTQFYSSSELSSNPYASNFGGFLSMRYTPSCTSLGEEGNSLLLTTTSVIGDEIVSSTTSRLERLYNFKIDKHLLTPEHCNYISSGCCRECALPSQDNARLCSAPIGNINRANTASVTAELGLAVPYTQTTQTWKKEPIRLEDIPSVRVVGPTDHIIISPFTVPTPVQ